MANNRLPIDRLNDSRNTSPANISAGRARERFSGAEMAKLLEEFSLRFKETYRGIAPASIARRLKTTDAVVKNYLEAKRFPTMDILLQIKIDTGVNLHWLLTGEGTRRAEFGNMFSEEEEKEINDLTRRSGHSFNEQVRRLAMGAVALLKKI